jgi:hypothetical protein
MATWPRPDAHPERNHKSAAKAAGVEHFYVEQEPPFIGMTAMEAATRDYQYLESLSK